MEQETLKELSEQLVFSALWTIIKKTSGATALSLDELLHNLEGLTTGEKELTMAYDEDEGEVFLGAVENV